MGRGTQPEDPERRHAGRRRNIDELKDRLQQAGTIEPEPDRSLAVVGVLNDAFSQLTPPARAVVVGGKAVDYWTGGMFATTDTDLLLPESAAIADCLEALGFHRRRGQRHWIHASLEILIEMPGNALSGGQKAAEVETLLPPDQVPVLSLVDTLLQRLHECVSTGHFDAAEQALALRESPALDLVELQRRAREDGLESALQALEELRAMVEEGSEIHPWDVHDVFDKYR